MGHKIEPNLQPWEGRVITYFCCFKYNVCKYTSTSSIRSRNLAMWPDFFIMVQVLKTPPPQQKIVKGLSQKRFQITVYLLKENWCKEGSDKNTLKENFVGIQKLFALSAQCNAYTLYNVYCCLLLIEYIFLLLQINYKSIPRENKWPP